AGAALDAYVEALGLAPADKAVHQALERFLDDQGAGGKSSASRVTPERRVEVAEHLLPVYEQADDPVRVARAVEVLRRAAGDFERLEHDRRLSALYGQRLKDPKRAYEAGLRVLATEPLDPDIRARLLEYAATLDREEDLAGHLASAL